MDLPLRSTTNHFSSNHRWQPKRATKRATITFVGAGIPTAFTGVVQARGRGEKCPVYRPVEIQRPHGIDDRRVAAAVDACASHGECLVMFGHVLTTAFLPFKVCLDSLHHFHSFGTSSPIRCGTFIRCACPRYVTLNSVCLCWYFVVLCVLVLVVCRNMCACVGTL